MSAALEQIKKAYEEESMSLQEIAEDQSLDVVAVKSALIQCSTKFRQDMGMEGESIEAQDSLNFTRDQARTVMDILYEMAITTEDEHLKRKLCLDVLDEHKGRREVKKIVKDAGTNIFLINSAIQRGREAYRARIGSVVNGERKAIEA